jgi:hypothetical protein
MLRVERCCAPLTQQRYFFGTNKYETGTKERINHQMRKRISVLWLSFQHGTTSTDDAMI